MLYIECGPCRYTSEFYTSKSCGSSQSYDINRRLVYTMHAFGQGFAGLEKFTTLMNMPKAMTQNNYDKIVMTVSKCVKLVAKETMADAAEEITLESFNGIISE